MTSPKTSHVFWLSSCSPFPRGSLGGELTSPPDCADVQYAQADKSSLPILEFLAKRQKQYQQQHLAALGAWQRWRRAQQIASPAAPMMRDQPAAVSSSRTHHLDWILPFQVVAVADTMEQRIASGG